LPKSKELFCALRRKSASNAPFSDLVNWDAFLTLLPYDSARLSILTSQALTIFSMSFNKVIPY